MIEGDLSPTSATDIVRAILYTNVASQPNVDLLRLTVSDGVHSTTGEFLVNVVSISRRRREVGHILQPIEHGDEWFGSSASSLTPLPFIMLLVVCVITFLFY